MFFDEDDNPRTIIAIIISSLCGVFPICNTRYQNVPEPQKATSIVPDPGTRYYTGFVAAISGPPKMVSAVSQQGIKRQNEEPP
jgi:hypothetical protein